MRRAPPGAGAGVTPPPARISLRSDGQLVTLRRGRRVAPRMRSSKGVAKLFAVMQSTRVDLFLAKVFAALHSHVGRNKFVYSKEKRMSRSRSVAAIIATAALAVSALAGCSASTDSADDADSGLNIWYVNPLPSYPAWGASSKQFEDNAEELGYRATAVGPSALPTHRHGEHDRERHRR